MRFVCALGVCLIAAPCFAQTPECERVVDKIKTQHVQIFRLHVAATSQAAARSAAEMVDTRLQVLALLSAIQSNLQIALASKCALGTLVVEPDPDGASAAQCGAKIRAANQQNNKTNLAAAYRLPECGGHFETQAKAADAEAARIAAQPKPPPPPPRPKAGIDQDDWRRRVDAWTMRRAECRAAFTDDERRIAECAGPIPEPRR